MKKKSSQTTKARARKVTFNPIGFIRSEITDRKLAPRQGSDGAPDAWLDIEPEFRDALFRLKAGDDIVVLTWLDRSNRDTLRVVPRRAGGKKIHGVFATRSPDRPNPIGIHPVTIRSIRGTRLRVGPIETLDGTPVLDIKIALNDR